MPDTSSYILLAITIAIFGIVLQQRGKQHRAANLWLVYAWGWFIMVQEIYLAVYYVFETGALLPATASQWVRLVFLCILLGLTAVTASRLFTRWALLKI